MLNQSGWKTAKFPCCGISRVKIPIRLPRSVCTKIIVGCRYILTKESKDNLSRSESIQTVSKKWKNLWLSSVPNLEIVSLSLKREVGSLALLWNQRNGWGPGPLSVDLMWIRMLNWRNLWRNVQFVLTHHEEFGLQRLKNWFNLMFLLSVTE